MNCSTIEIPSIGPVTIVKSQRARHIRITIKPDKSIRLTIPKKQSIDKAIKFLHSKIPWISKHLHRLSKLEFAQTNISQPEINEKQVRDILVGRLKEMAKIHNFRYVKVSIRNQKTKWGSCSTKNNISLNRNLARLPDELRDYVILHELVHTRIKNHSKKFWAELDLVIGGNAKEMSKKLRKYQLGIST